MTAIDYVTIADQAKAAVQDAGRLITLVRLSQAKDVSATPWKGTAAPRATPDATVSITGVFVDPTSLSRTGRVTLSDDFLKRSEQIIIIAPGSVLTDDLSTFDEVIDGSTRWRITAVHTLKPADTIVLYYVGVSR